MKNLLITIITMTVSFGITYYVLANVLKEGSNTSSSFNSTVASDVTTSDTEIENTVKKYNNNADNEMIPDLENILDSIDNWKVYYTENINLSSDFIALNSEGIEIDKELFLSELSSGYFAPVKLLYSENMYQLYELDDTQKDISTFVRDTSGTAYTYYLKEGTKFPEFDFTDLNGTRFSSENTKGKILIIKCWFIDSKNCVEEFPELNQLYDEYEAYEDVIFLSLAFDDSDKLREFLIKKEFRYPVIANQKEYITEELEVKQYPVHLVVNEEGYIEKMVSNFEELKKVIYKIAQPDLSEM